MAYTFDDTIISDLHKDARGFRPDEDFWTQWSEFDDDAKQACWDSLCADVEEELAFEAGLQKEARKAFDARIAETIKLGAGDVKSALRWMFEADNFRNIDYCYGATYVCYRYGLSYADAADYPFEEVCTEAMDALEEGICA